MSAKYYLDKEGLERLVEYINNRLDRKLNITDIPVLPEDLVREQDIENVVREDALAEELNDYALKSDVAGLVDLSEYAKTEDLEDLATDADLEALRNFVTGVYHYRGNVADLEELQAIENPQEGDVYNITSTGMNAAWTGEAWDEFGSVVDLSDYLTFEDVQSITIPELDAILYGGASGVVSDKAGIDAMIANDEPKVEIVLNKDLALTSAIQVPEGKEVVLDLNEKAMTGSGALVAVNGGEVTIKNGSLSSSSGRPVRVNSGEVTVSDAEITSVRDCAIDASGENSKVVIEDGAVVTAQEVPVLVTYGATAEINGGTLIGKDNFAIGGNGSNGQGNTNIIINGGEIIGHIQSNGYIAAGVYLPNSGTFTMNGGRIVSDGAGIVMRGGQAYLNGGEVIANGASGVSGKVGDARQVVGPYAVVYDQNSKYPAYATLALNIGKDMVLQGTDGDIQVLTESGVEANIIDNR